MNSGPTPLRNLLGAAHERASPSPSLPNEWVERIFEVMAAHYGARLADAWRGVDASQVKAVWAKELGRYNPAQIKRGIASLEQCRFPPTLPEFIALCKQSVPQAHLLKLPPPKPTAEQKEAGRKRFAEMKRSLGWA